MRLVDGPDGYKYIKPPYKNLLITDNVRNYNSHLNPLNKEDLRTYMEGMGLI
jgi:hypothetical protein